MVGLALESCQAMDSLATALARPGSAERRVTEQDSGLTKRRAQSEGRTARSLENLKPSQHQTRARKLEGGPEKEKHHVVPSLSSVAKTSQLNK